MSLIRLLRLKRAAFQLAYRNNENILNIALSSGYESHEGFSRSFKKHFNSAPTDFRSFPDWTYWHSNYQPILKLRIENMDRSNKLTAKVIDFPETPIATLEHCGSPHLLGTTIQKFIQWRRDNQVPPSKYKTFNIIYDDPNTTPPEDYRFDICCSINREVVKNKYGIVKKIIPSGKCAVIRHIGSDDSIGVLVNYLYTQWIEQSIYSLRDFPLFFERVSFFPEVPESEMETDIYLPIE
jgi:AraC family transcriptional regulator